jgi:hypothetical protein
VHKVDLALDRLNFETYASREKIRYKNKNANIPLKSVLAVFSKKVRSSGSSDGSVGKLPKILFN